MGDKNKTGAAAQGAVKPRVFELRGKRVVLDRELAAFVEMSTSNLNLYVKRNIHLFDENKRFKLSEEECSRLQFAILNNGRGSNIKYLPYAFTEEGVKMLEKVLKRSISVEFQEEEFLPAVVEKTWSEGTVELYYTNANINLTVRVEDETVWLAQEQMAQLFGTTTQNITMHIRNIFEEKEVEEWATCKDFLQVQAEGGREVRRVIKLYNLDIIISVGYRVKSIQGTRFRQWALKMLKEMILHKHYYDSRLDAMEQRQHKAETRLDNIEQQVRFIVNTNTPPQERLYKPGMVFDAHMTVASFIEMAQKKIILIDPYIDSSVLVMLTKRKPGVDVTIYHDRTKIKNKEAFDQDLALHNKQYPTITLIDKQTLHDRFIIVDTVVYMIGASIKDAGNKMLGYRKLDATEEEVLECTKS